MLLGHDHVDDSTALSSLTLSNSHSAPPVSVTPSLLSELSERVDDDPFPFDLIDRALQAINEGRVGINAADKFDPLFLLPHALHRMTDNIHATLTCALVEPHAPHYINHALQTTQTIIDRLRSGGA